MQKLPLINPSSSSSLLFFPNQKSSSSSPSSPPNPKMAKPQTLTLTLTLTLILHLLPFSTPVTFTVHPKTLPTSNSPLQITWSGVPTPSDLDFIGIYSPPDSPDRRYLGYLTLSSSPTWRSGNGTLTVPLVNLRKPYQLRLFRSTIDDIVPSRRDHDNNPLPQTKRRLAVSEIVGFERIAGPEQLHLAFGEEVDEMRVLFVAGVGGVLGVEYGVEDEELERNVGTVVRRYEIGDLCHEPANSSVGWRDPGFVHEGVMKGLEKGRRYYYRVGSDAVGWSPIYSFVSRNNNANETVAFLFGDMGTYLPYSTFRRTQEESMSTMKWILRDIEELGDTPAFVSHIGDISYARGYSWLWDQFFNQIEPVASRVPYHVCIGNHEYDWPLQPWKPLWSYPSYNKDGGGECGVPYSVKFHMPGNSSLSTGTSAPDTKNLYYSFDAGLVHFLYMSTETNFLIGSDQYNFIKKDLESVDRDKTPYVVFQGHRPMYTTSNEVRDAPLRNKMLENLEHLLVENSVTLAFWGHVHRYERFCPLNNYTCVGNTSDSNLEKATVHLVIGMAGMDWQPIWEPRPDHTDLPIFPQPKRSMYRGGEYGYTKLVATREKLTLTYIGNHDGQVHDTMEIFASKDSKGQLATSNKDEENGEKRVVAAFPLPRYLQYAGVMLLGALGGFALGFCLRSSKKEGTSKGSWTAVKSEEI